MHLLYKNDDPSLPPKVAKSMSKLSFLSGLISVGDSTKNPSKLLSECQTAQTAPVDLCKDKQTSQLCDGNLGIPRNQMPQITGEARRDYVKKKEEQGTKIHLSSVSADKLIPTQNELNGQQVDEMISSFVKGTFDPCNKEILTAREYVVDGHHRWAACRLINGVQKVITIDDSIDNVLAELRVLPGVGHKDIQRNILAPSFQKDSTSSDFQKNLKLIQEIQSRLNQERSIVVSGAPGSGKTEHLRLAENTQSLFDLRLEFLTTYYRNQGITDPERQKNIRAKEYQKEQFKKLELAWLTSNYDQIKKRLLESQTETIVFDEFDLVENFSETSIQIAKKMIDLAKDCRDAGKKVVLVIHEKSKQSKEVMDKLKEHHFLHDENDVVQTRYYSNEEQLFLLSRWEINGVTAENFIREANGLPAAFIPILNNSIRGNVQQLVDMASQQIARNYVSVTISYPPRIIALLQDLSLDYQIQNLSDEDRRCLLSTGLTTLQNGNITMPIIVKRVIQRLVRSVFI